MNDKKIADSFEFDDNIDFDGLDENDDLIEQESESEVLHEEDDVINSGDVNIISDYGNTEKKMCEDTEMEASNYDDNLHDEVYEIDVSYNEEKKSLPEPELGENTDEANSTDKFVRRFCIINVVSSALILCVLAGGIFIGSRYISSIEAELDVKNHEIAELESKNSILAEDYMAVINTVEDDTSDLAEIPETELEQGKIIFYDYSVGYSWIPVISGIEKNTYNADNFSVDDRYRMTYTVDGEESSYFGIDVSSYQGDIDWQLVKEDGVEFAFLRIGYRGYGEEGKLCPDEFFARNYEAAHDAGIDLGVYFFSQATSVAEAVEEAEFVLSLLESRTLEYPVVFDWENIYTGDPEDIPRTEDMMPQTLTLSAIAFCETVKDAGYEAMIYTNKKLATIKYDLRQLSDYPVWLAYYNTELDYYYDFDIWQYGTAEVDGIEGEVDVNISIIR